MTTKNNGATWAVVILVGLMLLVAFRSIFFVLPFGFFPGMVRVFRDMGHGMAGMGGLFGILPLAVMPLLLMALWIFVIFWVYRDAESRGMSGILWALLVFIGNVVGLIIYLIVRNEPGRRPPTAPAEKCPTCGNSIGAGFTFCPHCGAKLKPVCPSCGKPVDRTWKVCPNCGASLDPGKIEQA
jgi:hypothetical protein